MDSLAKMFNMKVEKFIAANGGILHTPLECSADQKDSHSFGSDRLTEKSAKQHPLCAQQRSDGEVNEAHTELMNAGKRELLPGSKLRFQLPLPEDPSQLRQIMGVSAAEKQNEIPAAVPHLLHVIERPHPIESTIRWAAVQA